MRVFLKKIKIINYKKIGELVVEFNPFTTIEGANRTGKSTVAETITWLLFGKNLLDEQKFEIKPLDSNNETNPKLETEIEAEYVINDSTIILSKKLREKWQKRRGSSELEFKGNETICEWNTIPVSITEFNQKRDSLINEGLFKLTTNPLYFNKLHWEKQREMLIELIGGIKQDDVIAGLDSKTAALMSQTLAAGRSIEESKAILLKKIKKINEELELIPSRIDQSNRNKPEVFDWDSLTKLLANYETEITIIDTQVNDKSKAFRKFNEDRIEEQNKVNELLSSLNSCEFELRTNFDKNKNEIRQDMQNAQTGIKSLGETKLSIDVQIQDWRKDIEDLSIKKAGLLARYKELNLKQFVFDPDKKICPTCKQLLLNSDNIDADLKTNFLKEKLDSLEAMKLKGTRFAKEIKEFESKKEQNEEMFEQLEQQITLLKAKSEDRSNDLIKLGIFDPSIDLGYNHKKEAHEKAKKAYDSVKGPKVDTHDLEAKKKEIKSKIDELKPKLENKKQIDRIDTQINELKASESAKAQEIANLEQYQFAIEAYEKAKNEALELKVNDKFSFVKFKLFEIQNNGGEKATCKALIDGVPYSDANTESKLNAGLDIIKTFSEKFNFYAPIILDNRESVTEIIQMDTQVINLVVNKIWPKLKVDPTPEETNKRIIEIQNQKP
jgi:chromosome segregation ATPase